MIPYYFSVRISTTSFFGDSPMIIMKILPGSIPIFSLMLYIFIYKNSPDIISGEFIFCGYYITRYTRFISLINIVKIEDLGMSNIII